MHLGGRPSAPEPAKDEGVERPCDDAVARALVLAMARGDPQAMEAFYDLYASRLYGLILGMVGGPDDAQEVLQDVMWQAWRLAPRYDPARACVRTWLHVIMRSRVLDWRRQEARRPAQEEFDHIHGIADADASRALSAAVEHEDLLKAQARLSDGERQAIGLTYYRGLTQAEAARTLGIPLGTLKSRVRGALLHLHDGVDSARPEGGPA